jgi:hypothetical protein
MTEPSTGDQFQTWLTHMDDAIEAFVASAEEPLRRQLDGTPASLDKLEAWLLSRYASVADNRPASEAMFIRGAARYLGEILHIATGSKWTIENRDKKFVYFGLPILHDGKFGQTPACPMTMVTASLDRRTGRYLSTILAKFAP